MAPVDLAVAADRAERQPLRDSMRTIIADLKVEQDRADEVLASASTTANEKKGARSTKRMCAACIDLAQHHPGVNLATPEDRGPGTVAGAGPSTVASAVPSAGQDGDGERATPRAWVVSLVAVRCPPRLLFFQQRRRLVHLALDVLAAAPPMGWAPGLARAHYVRLRGPLLEEALGALHPVGGDALKRERAAIGALVTLGHVRFLPSCSVHKRRAARPSLTRSKD